MSGDRDQRVWMNLRGVGAMGSSREILETQGQRKNAGAGDEKGCVARSPVHRRSSALTKAGTNRPAPVATSLLMQQESQRIRDHHERTSLMHQDGRSDSKHSRRRREN